MSQTRAARPGADARGTDPGRIRASAIEWNPAWQRFTILELGLTAGVFGTLGLGLTLVPDPPVGWRRPLLFDEPLRDLLRLDAERDRIRASRVSDVLQNISVALPYAEAMVLGLNGHTDVAWQMALINTESFAASAFMMLMSKRLVGRIRPDTEPCSSSSSSPSSSSSSSSDSSGDSGTAADFTCRSRASTRSFFCAHCAASFTAASLTCAHHRALSIFGSPAADGLACGGALALAAATSALRIVADRHWGTDVVVGAAVGVLSGYGLPYLVHYGAEAIDGDENRPISGALRAVMLAGPFNIDGKTSFAAGFSLVYAQRVGAPGIRRRGLEAGLALNAEGRLVRTSANDLLAELILGGEFVVGPVGLGVVAEVRNLDGSVDTKTAIAVGPSASVTLWDGMESGITLGARWTPLADGQNDQLAASFEIASYRWLALRLEGQTLRLRPRTTGSVRGSANGAVCLAGLGGRLPW